MCAHLADTGRCCGVWRPVHSTTWGRHSPGPQHCQSRMISLLGTLIARQLRPCRLARAEMDQMGMINYNTSTKVLVLTCLGDTQVLWIFTTWTLLHFQDYIVFHDFPWPEVSFSCDFADEPRCCSVVCKHTNKLLLLFFYIISNSDMEEPYLNSQIFHDCHDILTLFWNALRINAMANIILFIHIMAKETQNY